MSANKVNVYNKEKYDDSRQTNPGWMITFIRFSQRSDKKKNPIEREKTEGYSGLDTRKPLVVISDCTSVTVSHNKASFAHSAEVVLLPGDINYSTAIAPGDYMIVNMIDDDHKILNLYDRATNLQPINRYDDGFKGLFRVQSVHQTLQVSPDGTKRVLYRITGYAFGEFNNTIYFNPFLVQEYQKTPLFFLTAISDKWNLKIKDGVYNSVQNVMLALYSAFLGTSIEKLAGSELAEGLQKTPNRPYMLPDVVMRLMGSKGQSVSDLHNVIAGKQQYLTVPDNEKDAEKLKPKLKKPKNRIYTTGVSIEGHSYAKPEYFSQIKVWDILNQYLNPAINEMYTTFKPDLTNNDTVLPTLIIREKPFTTNRFAKIYKNKENVTRFLDLPRWVSDYDYVLSMNIGRDDASRFNFVQIFGRNQSNSPNASISFQTKAGNYELNEEDIRRSGLRPFVATIPFDYLVTDSKIVSKTPYWAKLIADWIIDSHLKLSGTISLAGIQKPISVGDNFQLGDIVYHIESVSHSCVVNPDGTKNFRTSLQLSFGVFDDPSEDYVPYAEMEYTSADSMRQDHYDGFGDVFPGVSDSQDLPVNSRDKGERKSGEENKTKERSFSKRDRRGRR